MAYQRLKAWNFGSAYAGSLANAGYALAGQPWTPATEVIDPDGDPTGGVQATVTFPDDYAGVLLWCPDTTATPKRYAFVEINDERIDMAQPIPDGKAATTGGALHGSWAAAFGKMVLDRATKSLRLFGIGSSSTPLASFTLDDGGAPTTRVPS